MGLGLKKPYGMQPQSMRLALSPASSEIRLIVHAARPVVEVEGKARFPQRAALEMEAGSHAGHAFHIAKETATPLAPPP